MTLSPPSMETDTAPETDLGALIAQRLCHDLVNPLGALGNGLELLAMTGTESPELALMRDSLAQALGRIKLYRLAFGAGSDTPFPARDLAAALQALGGSRKLELALDLRAPLTRSEARLIALLALCAETALAWGGRLAISSGETFALVAEAARLRQDLPGQETPTAPLVHFARLPDAARAAAREVVYSAQEGRLTFTAAPSRPPSPDI